jgi:hypothetical protein
MKFLNRSFRLLCAGIVSLLCGELAQPIHAQGVAISATYGPTVAFNFGNGALSTNFIAPNSTNLFPLTAFYTNAVTSQWLSNTWTGIIDQTKQSTFTPQFIFTSGAGITNTNNVVFQLVPSIDGVNFDTTNTFFYVTVPASSNSQVSFTTNFPSAVCGGIGFFKLNAIVNYNTNYLTNVTIQVGGKRVLLQ